MLNYTNIRIFSSEKAKHEGKILSQAVIHYLHGLKIAARCSVFRGREGLYESGEISSDAFADLSYNLPLLIDVLVPATESDRVLEGLRSMVHDGFIGVLPISFVSYQSARNRLPSHLLVKDIMTTPAIQAHPDFTVRTVLEILLDQDLKALPVVDPSGLPVGIVTTSDLMAAGMPVRTGLFSELPNREQEAFLAKAATIPVSAVMHKNPTVIAESGRAAHAVHLMVEKQHKRLPVVDSKGKLVGMIARIDLMRAVSSERPSTSSPGPDIPEQVPRTVLEIGKLETTPVLETVDLLSAIDALVKQGEERTAVVDQDGKLVGIISDRELFGVLNEGGLGNTVRKLFFPRHKVTTKVSQIMKRDVIHISHDSSLNEALTLMVKHGLKRLPIVDGEGHFLGMVRRDALLIAISHDL